MTSDFSGIKAVIFDMDGVLLLASACHDQAFRETLSQVGITNFSYPAIAGMRTDQALRKILVEAGREIEEEELKRLTADKQRRLIAALEREVPIASQSPDLIAHLRPNYRLAIASSALSHRIELFLRKSGYADAFEFFVDGGSVVNAKPAPDIYLRAVSQLGLEPEDCVIIEDALSGVMAAVAAEVAVIAVIGEEDPQQFIKAGVTKAVPTLKDIQSIL